MALSIDKIEPEAFNFMKAGHALFFKPSPLEHIFRPGRFNRRGYLKAKRRWFRDFRQEITWMRQGRN